MAHVHEEIVTIKLSKLVKDHQGACGAEIDPSLLQQVEALVQELVGDKAYVVEVSTLTSDRHDRGDKKKVGP